jgi:hypothetical protein
MAASPPNNTPTSTQKGGGSIKSVSLKAIRSGKADNKRTN